MDALGGCENESGVRCAARGIFRNRGISPAAGDRVLVETGENAEPLISEIRERRNFLVRPPLANLDKLVFVNSVAEPAVNRYILDKLVAIADSKGIEPVIVFTKIDIEAAGDLPDIYREIGIDVCEVDNLTGDGAERVRGLIAGKICAFVGNSGVGKSSLLNVLYPELGLETAHISRKLGRGRHTTRQVELYRREGGYIADTPGFSTVDTERYCRIPKGELDTAFREFGEFLGSASSRTAPTSRKRAAPSALPSTREGSPVRAMTAILECMRRQARSMSGNDNRKLLQLYAERLAGSCKQSLLRALSLPPTGGLTSRSRQG